jgi:hypothetical protein
MDLGLSRRRGSAAGLGIPPKYVAPLKRDRHAPTARALAAIVGFLGLRDPIPTGEGLPERLRAARRRLGLTQARLAGRLGLNRSTIQDAEAGRGEAAGTGPAAPGTIRRERQQVSVGTCLGGSRTLSRPVPTKAEIPPKVLRTYRIHGASALWRAGAHVFLGTQVDPKGQEGTRIRQQFGSSVVDAQAAGRGAAESPLAAPRRRRGRPGR